MTEYRVSGKNTKPWIIVDTETEQQAAAHFFKKIDHCDSVKVTKENQGGFGEFMHTRKEVEDLIDNNSLEGEILKDHT